MSQRLIIVYNPRSSKFRRVATEVIAPARQLKGFTIGKYEIKPTNVDDNAVKLSSLLRDGDLIISAGGDGTATITLNSVIRASTADLTLGVLGYGNFNDFAGLTNISSFSELIHYFNREKCRKKLYPLQLSLDDHLWRYGMCYFSVGMMAAATEIFDQTPIRSHLRTGHSGIFWSLRRLAAWYFAQLFRQHEPFLPPKLTLNHKTYTHLSDILWINGPTAAKLLRNRDFTSRPTAFLVSSSRLMNPLKLGWFMSRSLFFRLPGQISARQSVLAFPAPTTVTIQGEGEYTTKTVQKITVQKSSRPIRVITKP